MFEKLKITLILAISLTIIIYVTPFKTISNYISYKLYSKNNFVINLSTVNQKVTTISADSSNKLILKVEVKNLSGEPLPHTTITISEAKNKGYVYPKYLSTDEYGECLATYVPPDYTPELFTDIDTSITLIARINITNIVSTVDLKLTRIPIAYIPGYQETNMIFENLKEYLISKNSSQIFFSYNSKAGIIEATNELNKFLQKNKQLYLSEGVQIQKYNLITHSMGGLIARNYTCDKQYIKNNDVKKIIFVAVPHKGSHLASTGEDYFNDKGIKDLAPNSVFLLNTLPSLINKGLNNNIQTGNIIGEYDEVVTAESASLDEWRIKTEIFNVGESNFNVGNLLKGNIVNSTNHMIILNNRKVFKKIQEMLEIELPYPQKLH